MSDTVEYDHLIFPQKVSSDDYWFVYAAGENNVVILIHPTTYSEGIPEAYILNEDLVDTMWGDMLEAMECNNGKIYDDYDSRFW